MTATGQQTQPYPFGPAERLDLHPLYAEYRRDRPLARVVMPYGGEAWLVTRYADIRTVLSDPRFSRAVTVGRDVPRLVPQLGEDNILAMDPPEHTRLRRLVSKAFTPRRVEQMRPNVQAMVDELLDEMIANGAPADIAESLAWPLPVRVICEMLGVPVADRNRFRRWVDVSLALGERTTPEEIVAAGEELRRYMAGLIAQRRAQPTDDLLGALVVARDEQDKLSEEELLALSVTLLAAGHETTANQIGSHIYLLLSRPELWRSLVADPGLIPSAVEELLRFTPLGVSGGDVRVATVDVELAGGVVRAGEAVVANPASGNRDETVFDNPDEIDLARKHNPHIAFGYGVHHCLGAPLARLELQVVLGTLVRRLPGLRLAVPAEEVQWRTDRLVRGVTGLSVSW
ncbi:cytochrome P450 [Thermostaphylospora chromogena]|uniref:Cytochrome P450 n=2 Tax=Thermostaphylospora chromogena TaxID=35622 RepID=A0A1H0ZPS3_9ACTN|nr:cytochrome P450 [Thermostaphylospora chromogena]SDQ29460.1 Cytochrome P450 [Thermostaphylospora chromogena]